MKHTLLPVEEFVQRRQQVLAQLPANSIAIFGAGKEVTRSNDTEYLFCQNKYFYYLTGFNEPDALLVLIKSAENNCESVLFCRDKDPLQEIWHGRRIGYQVACSEYCFDVAYPLSDLDSKMLELLNGKQQVHQCQGQSTDLEAQLATWLTTLKQASRQGKIAPNTLVDCTNVLDEMRLIKSAAELNVMRQANHISGLAHQRAMAKTAVGKFEYQIEAEILHEFARHGARYTAYNSIVAGGDNGNILHYTDNSDELNDQQLLLIDAGAELAGYAADITRTFPINGKFTSAQKALYELVLAAQNAAISAIKPQMTLAELNDIANRILTQGLLDLGLFKGNLEELLAAKACKKYFIHGLGHWLGLDVHDVGNYQIDEFRRQARPFEAGMVLTIEPGLYIPLNDTSVEAQWRGIAIRIEDNIVVTATGYENLTNNAPKTVLAIEALMAK